MLFFGKHHHYQILERTTCCKSITFLFELKIKLCMALLANTRRTEIEDY